jgi:hypothetical protein
LNQVVSYEILLKILVWNFIIRKVCYKTYVDQC